MKTRILVTAMSVLVFAAARGQDAEKRTFRLYPLNSADPAFVLESVETLLDGSGKVLHDRRGNRLLVSAAASRHAEIKELLRVVDVPAPNVRIEVEISDARTQTRSGGGLAGHGTVVIGPDGTRVGGHLTPHLDHRHTTRNASVRQTLLVQSGGSATLSVGKDIPYLDWIIQRGRHWGYVEQAVQMQRVGAFLRVEPHCLADGRVRIRVTPELSAQVGKDLRRVEYTRLQSEVTTQSGMPVTLGSFGEHQEFYDRFLLGVDRTGRERRMTVTLTPRVIPTGPPQPPNRPAP